MTAARTGRAAEAGATMAADPADIAGGVRTARAHDSALKHVSGTALYTDDIPEPPGTLQVLLALSTRAHARIVSLDLTAVRASAGVVAVLTADDIPGRNDVSPVAGDDPLFAAPARPDGGAAAPATVHYFGQSLFAVAAESIGEARTAAARAEIGYEDLPAILTIEQALAAQSLLEPPSTLARGDAAAAIAGAPHTVEGRIETGGQEHFYLEGQAALAVPGEDEDMTVHCSSQHPSEIQHTVSGVLGVPGHSVTVEVRRMGGGFGGKESQGNLPAAAAALAARLTGRPAKCVYDRDDDMLVTGKRHDFRIDYRAGFDDSGRILGVEFDQALRCGMSWDLSGPIADRAMFHADNCYHLPNVRIASWRCRTNTQSNTAFRGFGGPQGMVGIERVLDHIAAALGRDPAAVRAANFYAGRDSGSDAGRTTPYGMVVEDCIIADIWSELAALSDYAGRRAEIRRWNRDSPILKRGIAMTPVKFGISFTNTMLNQAGALVHVYNDGSIHLNHGGTEMGQGLFTKVAQVAASEFQVDLDRVKITATTTAKVPNTSATAASAGSDLNGMATRDAVGKIRRRLAAFLAERYQARPADVRFAAGRVHIGAESLSFDEAVAMAYAARVPLSATGFYATPKIGWDKATGRGRPFYYFSYGAAVAEAAIDTLTGENRLLRVDIVHDVGKSLNPAIDLGQIEGGFVQGAGWLTTEELVWDAGGRLTTHAPSTYKIPACSDRAPVMNIRLFDSGGNVEETIYRSKAVGEPPLMLGISALMALSDAIASVGDYRVYPSLDAPATPERVLFAVERVRRAAAEAEEAGA